MKVAIACGAMEFGPQTPLVKALGGSETAALMASKEIAKRGHDVTMYCNLPPVGRVDYVPSGVMFDGVTFKSLGEYPKDLNQQGPEVDVAIIVRDPNVAAFPVRAKKKILWMHDIATKRGMQRAFDGMAWTIDEVWTVSEFHRQQVHATTGYPLDFIYAMRNGIVPIATQDMPKLSKQLVYAARPERGLDNLIQPGGVMENLPDYTLVVAMYDHYPEHMKAYYQGIFERMKAMPNVKFIGPQAQTGLRQIIHDSAAYIFPTQFEEVSCILARESIEQKTPFLTTRTAALPETLKGNGIFFEDWLVDYAGHTEPAEKGSPAWCKLFAQFVRDSLDPSTDQGARVNVAVNSPRSDLYWDGAAEMMEARFSPKPFKGGDKPNVVACVIALNNEDTILRMLRSLEGNVDAVHVALGPSTDDTRFILHDWSDATKIEVKIFDVPQIEPRKFGFDDARKVSIQENARFDWMIWIDTDEYLSGNFRRYLRNNMLQGYIIPQHHFTVEPRGMPIQIDRPARLLRVDANYIPRGHIHEHFELEGKEGVGRCWMLPDVDIGHVGYVNEAKRKERFKRNFDFLQWDHDTNGSERKLHHFLWFRDIVHRMRLSMQKKDTAGAKKLADEAVSYYAEHREAMGSFGQGVIMALSYVSEVYHALGIGVAIDLQIKVDDLPPLQVGGRFKNLEELNATVGSILKPVFDDRSHKYW